MTVMNIRRTKLCRFKDFPATTYPDDYLYSWNPCEPFSQGSSCEDVAVCQKTKNGSNDYDLGHQSSVQFQAAKSDDTGEVLVVAMYITEDQLRVTLVVLQCATGGTNFTVVGAVPANTIIYHFILGSPCACPGAGPNCAGSSLSIGTLICISVLAASVVYFIFGFILKAVVKRKVGWEAIPNGDFWKSLPSYIKDGCIYATSHCRRLVKDSHDYSAI
ncbi:Hypp5570 [Branchiostoma lanceolatum]|uniref:Hypp5570 protein n=1 Tax=Branchiostoma lanceolatum TaxID=7740 RepID=A0A8J9VEI9_BRALA|nr:Hypp5570 [Branchiostoma lanceolatum]